MLLIKKVHYGGDYAENGTSTYKHTIIMPLNLGTTVNGTNASFCVFTSWAEAGQQGTAGELMKGAKPAG